VFFGRIGLTNVIISDGVTFIAIVHFPIAATCLMSPFQSVAHYHPRIQAWQLLRGVSSA